jgi:hypothetical protein
VVLKKEDIMSIHAQLLGYGRGAHHREYNTVEEAKSALAALPYGKGNYQELIDTESGVRWVRADGSGWSM